MKKEYPDILKLEGEKWHNPDPATGKLGTRVPAEWLQTTEDSLKSLTLEMLEVLKSAGINPNELNNTQVRDAIQKMILARVINYNDIQGRPVVKDSLGDDRNNPASQRVVNDVNRDVVTAQKTANNAHALAQTKQDKFDFVGSGKVMKEGAYGVGTYIPVLATEDTRSGLFLNNTDENIGKVPPNTFILKFGGTSDRFIGLKERSGELVYASYGSIGIRTAYDDKNTTTDKSGFIRASGVENALVESDVTNSLGNSKKLVACQALVNNINNTILSHGLGYNQTWIDVESSRSSDVSYTNNTSKPIIVSISKGSETGGSNMFSVSGVVVSRMTTQNNAATIFVVVPPGANYLYSGNFSGWKELR